jgi:hypothetical protein
MERLSFAASSLPSKQTSSGVNSPSYSLIAESEALLKESDLPNPFLARPLFTATNLANRRRQAAASSAPLPPQPVVSTSPGRGRPKDDEPVTTTIFPRVKVATFPALVVQAEHQLRVDRHELVQQAHTALQTSNQAAAESSVSLDDEDVEIMKSLHNAAVGLASGQSGVREATKRLMIVCREQQEEIDALARKQSEAGVTTSQFVSTCLELEERCRTTALRVENCSTQINRIELDVSDALAESKASLRRVLSRVVKTTLMANAQAAATLSSSTHRQLLQRYWAPWAKFCATRGIVQVLLRKTTRGTMQVIFSLWSRLFLQKRRDLRKRHDLLHSKTQQNLGTQILSKWRGFVVKKVSQRRACETLLMSTTRGSRQMVFMKWRRYVAFSQKQEVLFNGLATLLYGCERAHARWRLAVWMRFHHYRKVQRRNYRLSSLLASNTEKSYRSFVFRGWMRATLESSARKHLASTMAVSTRKFFVLRFFKRWEEHRRVKWVDRRIVARVAPLQASLDLALATAARNGALVSELLERQIALEAQILQLSAMKVSIRQLRPEAFRGSLIDLDNVNSPPSKIVEHLADESLGRPPRASVSHARDDADVEQARATKEVVTAPSASLEGSSMDPPFAPTSLSQQHRVSALPSTTGTPSAASVQQHTSYNSRPSGAHDPLQSLAQHYGVTTPSVKRRALP